MEKGKKWSDRSREQGGCEGLNWWKKKTDIIWKPISMSYLKGFTGRMINTEVLGNAFEPEQPFENADGTPIRI